MYSIGCKVQKSKKTQLASVNQPGHDISTSKKNNIAGFTNNYKH